MHSLAECPLRTFCSITTTDCHPFHILHLDNAALDLFLSIDTCIEEETLSCSSHKSLSWIRTRALDYLRGKPISEIVKLDQGPYPTPSTVTSYVIQPSTILDSILSECPSNDFNSTSIKSSNIKRLHGCIHSAVPHSSSSVKPSLPVASSTTVTPHQELQHDQNLSTHSKGQISKGQTTFCRVYVLKDVTDIQNLALEVMSDLYHRQQQQRIHQSSRKLLRSAKSMTSIVLSHTDRTNAHHKSLSSQKPYSTEPNLDWSPQHPSSCSSASYSPLYPLNTSPSSTPNTLSHKYKKTKTIHSSENQGLLLLHVTRFGTIDHSYVISQQQSANTVKSHTNSFYGLGTTMTNTSIMTYVHPDDIRTLCRGLDQICKSHDIALRIRWNTHGKDQQPDHDDCEADDPAESIQEGYSRMIEYKGELFEEWVDPTAVPEPTKSPKILNQGSIKPKEQLECNNYIWIEVKGRKSNGQPLLVLRPLTAQEIEEQHQITAISTNLAASAQTQVQIQENNHSQPSKEWKNKTRRMGLEEGRNLPNRLNISALTSLAMTPRRDDLNLHIPGSFPLNVTVPLNHHSSQLALSTSTCCSRSTSGIINMPSMLTYPANNPPWATFMTIALDAWKEWIQTVHAGQAQFQDWCEYLLETTIDRMIESVSLGLTLLGVEDAPSGLQLEGEQKQVAIKIDHSKGDHQGQLSLKTWENPTDAKSQQKKKFSGGMRRVGEILHNYPSLEGVVVTFGNSWLGRKIKSRLEHKLLDRADQVVDWWFDNEGEEVNTPSQTTKSTDTGPLKPTVVKDAAVATTTLNVK